MLIQKPSFPLVIVFHEDNDRWTLNNLEEVAQNLEWFDSDDPDEQATVTDSKGRLVKLKVEALTVIECALKNSSLGD